MQHHPAGSAEPTWPANEARGSGNGSSVHPRVRVAALAVLAVYLVFVGWQALRPLSVLWVSPANLEPFATIRSDINRSPEAAFRTIGLGMLRLAPLGLLLPLLGQRLGGRRFASLIRTVFAGAMISLVIELSQSLVPSRVADVDAIILNTAGIAVAHQLCYARLRALALHDPRGTGSRATPGHQPDPARPRRSHDRRTAQADRRGHGHGGPPQPERPAGHPDSAATRDRAAPHGVRGAALSR